MPILRDATVQDKERLLELFPIAVFREVHAEQKGTKEEICFALAGQLTEEQVVTFVRTHLPRCKQHVYIFDRVGDGAVNLRDVAGGDSPPFSFQYWLLRILVRHFLCATTSSAKRDCRRDRCVAGVGNSFCRQQSVPAA